MNVLLHGLAVAVLLAVATPPLYAAPDLPPAAFQQSTTAQAEPDSPYTFKVDATLVNVDVLVTDEDGRVLSNLQQQNFRVLDNGVPQTIVNFAPTTAPITIVLLLEYSADSYNYFAGKAADWGSAFLDHLEPTDWIALVTFDMRSTVRVDFTHKLFEVRDSIATLGFPQFSEANLFDALIDTLDKLDPVRARTAILVMATGANSFSAASLDDVYQRLRQTDTTIFCIGLAEAEYLRSGDASLNYAMEKNWLTAFAERTGGFALFPRFQGELPDIFRSVVGFLRNEYTLSFRPPPQSRDGRFHTLRVQVVGPDGKPLRVTDAKGRSRKIEVYAREGYTAPSDNAPRANAP